MSLYNEIEFENEICEHLAANRWMYSSNDDGYDRARALFPEDVLAWVEATQTTKAGMRSSRTTARRPPTYC